MRAEIEILDNGRTQKYYLRDGERPFTTHQVLQHWQTNKTFRSFFIQLLIDAPLDAYFWETPPLTKETLERPLWLSTSGLGVFWLHVRLDSRPKYYTFRPYAAWPPA